MLKLTRQNTQHVRTLCSKEAQQPTVLLLKKNLFVLLQLPMKHWRLIPAVVYSYSCVFFWGCEAVTLWASDLRKASAPWIQKGPSSLSPTFSAQPPPTAACHRKRARSHCTPSIIYCHTTAPYVLPHCVMYFFASCITVRDDSDDVVPMRWCYSSSFFRAILAFECCCRYREGLFLLKACVGVEAGICDSLLFCSVVGSLN